jgi:hypothetical protein
MGIKPPTQLVKPAPKEIPMPVPRKAQFLNRKSINPDNPLFKSKKFPHGIHQISREFDLNKKVGQSKFSLFHQKRQEIMSRHDPDSELYEKDVKMDLVDVKEKFTKE